MGLILDSSVLIAAERLGQNARQMLTAVSGRVGDTNIAMATVCPFAPNLNLGRGLR